MSVRGQRLSAAGCVSFKSNREMQGQRLQHLVSFNCHLHSRLIIIFYAPPPPGWNNKLFVRNEAWCTFGEKLFIFIWNAESEKFSSFHICGTFFLLTVTLVNVYTWVWISQGYSSGESSDRSGKNCREKCRIHIWGSKRDILKLFCQIHHQKLKYISCYLEKVEPKDWKPFSVSWKDECTKRQTLFF